METNPFAHYLDKLAAGAVTYEDAADMFMASAVGRATGATREDFLARARARFPTQEELNASMQEAADQFAQFMRAVRGPGH